MNKKTFKCGQLITQTADLKTAHALKVAGWPEVVPVVVVKEVKK